MMALGGKKQKKIEQWKIQENKTMFLTHPPSISSSPTPYYCISRRLNLCPTAADIAVHMIMM